MDVFTIGSAIQKKEFLEELLGEYKGAMKVGIGRDPYSYKIAVKLQVEPHARRSMFPIYINIDGEDVYIQLSTDFVPPDNWGPRPDYAKPDKEDTYEEIISSIM